MYSSFIVYNRGYNHAVLEERKYNEFKRKQYQQLHP
jgi:hypothetical protein